jgi:CRISPR-associated protein Cas1
MIKRTLYFSNPAYLSCKLGQLIVRLPEVENNSSLTDSFKKEAFASIPIEDIGIVMLDNQQIIITQGLIQNLLENNVAIVSCDSRRHPTGLMLPLEGNTIQSERYKSQIEASEPLKKNLWKQTVKSKILNQAALLKTQGIQIDNMLHWADSVKSGDPNNYEARAAAYYWVNLFGQYCKFFTREREGIPPNNLLNYGYAILRAIVARALVGSGLLPTLGIHHHNRYNAFCLADDIMEPYRPFVDVLVLDIVQSADDYSQLNPKLKAKLIGIASSDIMIGSENSPLMVGVARTTTSLVYCFEGVQRNLLYPTGIL